MRSPLVTAVEISTILRTGAIQRPVSSQPDGGPAREQQQGEQPGLQEDLALLRRP